MRKFALPLALSLFALLGATRSTAATLDGLLPSAELKQQSGSFGFLTTSDGKPAAGVYVWVAGTNGLLELKGRSIRRLNDFGERSETDEGGRFTVLPQGDPFALVAATDAGFAATTGVEFATNSVMVLQPWSRIEGTILKNGKPFANQELFYIGEQRLPVRLENSTKTDENGRFVFDNVPAGYWRIQKKVPLGENFHSYKELEAVDVLPGSTNAVHVNSKARPVTGKLNLTTLENLPSGWVGFVTLQPDVKRPEVPQNLDEVEFQKWVQKWRKSDAGREYERAVQLVTHIKVESDGRFRTDEVSPGKYTVVGDVQSGGNTIAQITAREVSVPEISASSSEPVDLGEFEVKKVKHLKVGDLAPDWSVPDLADGSIKLADFRGKYVLLDFWATWCGPCVEEMPHLKELYEEFGKDARFAMISLSLDQSKSAPKKFARDKEIHWLQGFLGEWSKDTVTKDYGVRGIPSVFLIGPDGKIVATGLRGDATRAAVKEALKL